MTNIYQRFKSLLPTVHNELVDITANNGNGTSTGQTLSGATVIVKGESVAAGGRALVRNGEIVRAMPGLPVVEVEV